MLPDKRTGAEESHAIERKTEDPAGCGPSKGFSEYARHGLAGHFWCEFVLSISIASYQLLRMVGALAAHLRRSFGLVTWVGGIKVRELFFFRFLFSSVLYCHAGLLAQRCPGFVGSISFNYVTVLMVSWGI